jgi:hypothetical protein
VASLGSIGLRAVNLDRVGRINDLGNTLPVVVGRGERPSLALAIFSRPDPSNGMDRRAVARHRCDMESAKRAAAIS